MTELENRFSPRRKHCQNRTRKHLLAEFGQHYFVVPILLAFVLATNMVPSAQALAPEFEVDRLVLAAETAIEQNQWQAAAASLKRAATIGVTLPANYYYFLARVEKQSNNLDSALRASENYIQLAGKNGDYYAKTLKLITRLQQQPSNTSGAKNSGRAPSISWAQEPGDNEDYVSHIQFLYQNSSATNALLTHINNLLSFYGYGDTSITAASQINATNRFKLSVTGQSTLVTHRRDIKLKGEVVSNTRLSVYGINPYVLFSCRGRDQSCIIKSPATGDLWLQIVNNDEAAGEISKALTELIKLLQKNG